ncbi:hypothetical protein [Bradyrhizobium sp. Ash2021]|uniref:hypothetical protein n=1 Tax=Bradyrhizobium sp. Ash2021 TaxID=2954771 RepID=UPI00281663C3|nr:hypothetical protein [Bradyrhizobium sp. Ash2021]WMT77111.1 hypothetical protein NL528_12520 [Bradyrhizobium sp. Ash2021]
MRDRRAFLAVALVVATTAPARAFSADGCEQQRKQYPANWNDTSAEKTLFTCESQQGRFYVKIGATDEAGRTLMSLVPFSRTNAGVKVETGLDVLRIWLDKEQTRRLRGGKYLATVVRKENSCWIRGNIDEDVVFLMDNAHPREDDPGAAGSFYNKAPRFTVLGNGSVNCEPFK